MIGQRGGFLCGTDPARLYSGGQKNKIKHKLLTSNKGKTVSGLGTRNIITEHRLVQGGRPRQTDWHRLTVLHVTVIILAGADDVPPASWISDDWMFSHCWAQITSGRNAGWLQNSSSGQTSCCSSIIYEFPIELSALVDFMEDVDTSCQGVRTCLNKSWSWRALWIMS